MNSTEIGFLLYWCYQRKRRMGIMTTYFFKFANLCGLVSFSIAGAIQGEQHNHRTNFLRFLPCVVLTALGGGILFRDLLLLCTFPNALLERQELYASIVIAVIIYHFFHIWETKYHYLITTTSFKGLMILADALGSGIFICSGINKALDCGMPGYICILAGIVSTFGGGFLAALWCGETIRNALVRNLLYKLIVISNSIGYYQFIKKGIPQKDAQIMTIIYVTIFCVLKGLTVCIATYFNTNVAYITCIYKNIMDMSPYYIIILYAIIEANRFCFALNTKSQSKCIVPANRIAILRNRTYHMLLYR